ncbi:hypothetical protein GCM10007052_37580 [Halioglobus japonicus]|nr:hypothetical protein GCM10007052_37580 [Halioglobus japonicus]
MDNKTLPVGNNGEIGVFNTPTVFNAALSDHLMFDGSAVSLKSQAKRVLVNFREMGNSDGDAIAAELRQIAGYLELFAKAFSEGEEETLTFDNIAVALAEYQETLITPSPFDRFLKGDSSALSAEATAGLLLFMEQGCAGCHSGAVLGGRLLSTKNPMLRLRRNLANNLGRTARVRVPQLRNVTRTQPYLHRGSAETIEAAIQQQHRLYTIDYYAYARSPSMGDENMRQLIAFLQSLQGRPSDSRTTVPPLIHAAAN